jgi:hypothetical protein
MRRARSDHPPAIPNFTSSRPPTTSHCPHAHPEHAPDAPVNMSDNENNDAGGDEMVTKPFKFVTGKLFRAAAFMKSAS